MSTFQSLLGERVFLSQYSISTVGFTIYVNGVPAQPDGDTVVVSILNLDDTYLIEPDAGPVPGTGTFELPTDNPDTGKFEILLSSVITQTPGLYKMVWSYEVNSVTQTFVSMIEVGEASAAYDSLSEDMKGLVESVYTMFADLFDSPFGGPHLCVDSETEALTQDGWKMGADLNEGDLVLTLDHETGLSSWQPVEKVNRYSVTDKEMVSIETKVHSSLTTKSHRWPVLARKRTSTTWNGRRVRGEGVGSREWRQSSTLSGSDQIITGAPLSDLPTEAKWSDSFVELMGWAWTEGHFDKDDILRIGQSGKANPDKVLRIRRALTNLFGGPIKGMHPSPKWWEHTTSDMHIFTMNVHATRFLKPQFEDVERKVVSWDWLRTLTQAQLDMFIDVSIQADGYRSVSHTSISQADQDRLDAFDFACILAGKTPRQRPIKGRGAWRTTLRPNSTVDVRKNPKGVRYTGDVWCPTVPNGTWLARRNGTVWYTGNSVYFQTRFGRGRLAELLYLALSRLNVISQPTMIYDLDAVPGPVFPLARWGFVLHKATYIECIKHLIRSYVEQPAAQGVTVSRLDRRDYMDRWERVLRIEEDDLERLLDTFKIAHMGLGRVRTLVAGGVFGKFGPTRLPVSGAARGYYWSRYH